MGPKSITQCAHKMISFVTYTYALQLMKSTVKNCSEQLTRTNYTLSNSSSKVTNLSHQGKV